MRRATHHVYVEKPSRTFEAPFSETAQPGIGPKEAVSKRGMTPTKLPGVLLYRYKEEDCRHKENADSHKREERKFQFLIFEHPDEAQDEELMKCSIKVR